MTSLHLHDRCSDAERKELSSHCLPVRVSTQRRDSLAATCRQWLTRASASAANPFRRGGLVTLLLASLMLVSACGGGGGGGGTDVGSNDSNGSGSSPGPTSPYSAPHNAPDTPVSYTAAARFLDQASFGPTSATIARVQALGMSAYLDEQLATASSSYDTPLSTDTNVLKIQNRFFSNAVSNDDQLRQRVAFALSQIFVISTRKTNEPGGFVEFQRLLLAGAFGNYHDLLRNITLNPTMGHFLDMVNTTKANTTTGTTPNENYAREVLQLFSIGMVKLNIDGTPMLDGNDKTIPSYNQSVIEGFAKAFTGWTYPTKPGNTTALKNPKNFVGQMQASESNHDTGTKLLLDGVTLPAGQSAAQDLADALQNIFNHPNVGPFISFRLIQQLVTSNPSPEYVGRVAGVFNNNGKGVRGDLGAVVKAILLDSEARRNDTPGLAQATDGKLKDPILMMVGLLRAMNATTTGDGLTYFGTLMGQELFAPLSVFNFYPPTHQISGTRLYAPEFNIRNNPTIIERINLVSAVVYGWMPQGTNVDLTEWIALASDNDKLIDAIDKRLMHGDMSSSMRASLYNSMNLLSRQSADYKARAALFLAAASTQYSIQQ